MKINKRKINAISFLTNHTQANLTVQITMQQIYLLINRWKSIIKDDFLSYILSRIQCNIYFGYSIVYISKKF